MLTFALALLLSACTGAGEDPDAAPSPAPTISTPPKAEPPPARPQRFVCRTLSFEDALAPSQQGDTVACRRPHTSQTFAVGQLRTTVAGHLIAVDSDRVQRQVARTCPRKLADFLGTTDEALRLSLLRAVWFTPTLEESDAGAAWFRCDVVAVAAEDRLGPIKGSLRGALADPARAEDFAMCGTSAPDAADFTRVLCREDHTWRAIETVDLAGRRYPGVKRVRAAGQDPCNAAAREVADDVLDYEWGYEWPTAEQWAAGQRYGRCWAPV